MYIPSWKQLLSPLLRIISDPSTDADVRAGILEHFKLMAEMARELDKDALEAARKAILHTNVFISIEHMREAIRAYLDAADDWRPIETAPKDGTEILAAIEVHNTTGRKWWERRVISFDECRNEIGLDYDHGWSWEDYTKWRPLPSPPKEG